MQTRWRVHNLFGNACLGQHGPANGPYHIDVFDVIQSFSGTTSIIIPFHAIVRPGTVDNPTYVMMSGTTSYANAFGDWIDYFGNSIFSVRAVDVSDNPLFDGTLAAYTGSADGNRRIDFAPILATEIYGIEFLVSGAYPAQYVKRTLIANYPLLTGGRYIQNLYAPYWWSFDSIGAFASSGTLTGGAVLYTYSGTTNPTTFDGYVDILPAVSGSGVLYYLATQSYPTQPVYPNDFVRETGWQYWLGPPPPVGKKSFSAVMGLEDDIDGWIGYGKTNAWSISAYYPTYFTGTSSPAPGWLKHTDFYSDGVTIFFTHPSLSSTYFYLDGRGLDTGSRWYLEEDQLLSADFGLADSGTKFRLDIETIDIYNYCNA